jgi:protein-disulfide isomerase
MKHTLAMIAAALIALSFVRSGPADAAEGSKPAAPTAALSEEQTEAMKALVKQYILDNPEVIIESMQNYQIRQHLAEQQAAAAAVIAHADEIKKDPSAPVAGNANGDVTVVEFFDYRCPYCKRVFPAVRDLLKSDGNIRYVFKELPILGPDSVTAAHAALAAWSLDPEKYLAFHSALMEARGPLGEEQVLAIAKTVGLDPGKLKKAMAKPEIQAAIERNLALAQKLNIQGTPAFVVGDTLVPGAVDADQLRELVAAARKG